MPERVVMQYSSVDNRQYTTVSRPFSSRPFVDPERKAVPEQKRGTMETAMIDDYSDIECNQRTDVISVLIVDDHALIREGLRQLFELEEDIQIVGDASDGFEALRMIRQLRPNVV